MFTKRNNKKILNEYIKNEYNKINELTKNELENSICLSFEEFQYLIISIYEVLKKTNTKEEVYNVTSYYLELVKAYSLLDNNDINLNYFINRIECLAFYHDKKVTKKYENNIN